MAGKILKFALLGLTSGALLLLTTAIIANYFLHVNVLVHGSGTSLITPNAHFYIPASKTIKVYSFSPIPTGLDELVKSEISNVPSTFGIYIKNLSTGQSYSLNSDQKFTAASLYKLAVMFTIYKKGAEGKLDINKKDIQSNLAQMIEVSSNEAALYLVNTYTSWKEITQNMHDIGLSETDLTADPLTTTPTDMGKLLELLADGKAVNLDASVAMLDLMIKQKRNDRIPVLLPEGVEVAHKTGELYDVRHDAGIVLGPDNDYILVLMSKDSPNPESVKPIMAQLSVKIYDYFKKQWARAPEIL